MSTEETIAYLLTYIKACKIKGIPYILTFMGILYLIDEDLSTVYIMPLDHVIDNVATDFIKMNNGILKDISIYNLIWKVLEPYRTLSIGDFRKISRTEVDYDIPAHASDNCKLTRYYFDDNPTKTILVPEFYGMVPINKSDSYEIYHRDIDGYSSIIMYHVMKKKPKMEITMYRHIVNL